MNSSQCICVEVYKLHYGGEPADPFDRPLQSYFRPGLYEVVRFYRYQLPPGWVPTASFGQVADVGNPHLDLS